MEAQVFMYVFLGLILASILIPQVQQYMEKRNEEE